MRRSRKAKGKWVFVPESKMTPEEIEKEKLEFFHGMPFATHKDFQNYFPGDNKVPDGGAWVLVKEPPHTEFTVPPMSIWFAEPWPMNRESRLESHRVKIVTPRGDLGLFPCEYSLIKDPQKFYEFVGDGMSMHFFGNEEGVPKDKLFYLRSRGVSKKDALAMLIAEIKCHGVMWVETDKEVAMHFCRSWPDESRLATA
jgi:hypothetical protein